MEPGVGSGVVGGCQAILQFDEDKLNTGGSGGSAGDGGSGATSTTGTAPNGGGGSGASSTGGSGGSGGTGGMMGNCDGPEDCPDTGSECITATCEGGTCGTQNVAAGTAITNQTDGDCKTTVCDGNGAVTTEDDDADALDDGNDCTLDTCNAGMPESTPAVDGTTCNDNGGAVCDGLGACVECLTDANCAAPTPKCTMNTCVSASCGDGVKNGTETDIDCGGACGATCVPGKTCGANQDCAEGVCNAGICAPPTCTDAVENGSETDVDCGGGACNKCGPNKGCDANTDCAGNQCTGVGGTCVPNCLDGVKNGAETGVDCGGTCGGCMVGGPCTQDTDCVSTAFCDVNGTCSAKKPNGTGCVGNNQCSSAFCTDGVCCNTMCSGTCQACNQPGQAGTCLPIAAGQDPIDECAGTQVCDGTGGCKKGNGSACAGASECATGQCVDGVCCNSSCVGTCIACNVAGLAGTCTNVPNGTDPQNECPGTVNCNGSGACGSLLGNGSVCTVGNECQSGNCIDGVCCNSTCTQSCQACNIAGSLGTCTNIASGQDPSNECSGTQVCNGSGVCKKVNADACANGSECLSANCADGLCCNTACSGTCQACNITGSLGTCSNVPNGQDPSSECPGGTSCNGAAACTLFTNGTACTINGECSSGACVDGVCCNNTCNGTCQACNITGSVGTCTNVPSNQDPANECAGGECNGAAACEVANGAACSTATQCQSGFCTDGVCCSSACGATCQACNIAGSVGTCGNIPANTDPGNECAGGECNGSGACEVANGGTCTLSSQCISGNCVDGVCCDTACTGTCMACDLTGSVGVCKNVPSGSDPDAECSGATTCNGLGACALLGQGSACSSSSECATGFCADGYCCNSSCTGLCKTCDGNLSEGGVNGTCSDVILGLDPYNECSGTSVCCLNVCKSAGQCAL
ncbi:MAG: hypothetical protein IPK82_08605 [Polyangiaceae bacterium]|nr:hypothetical protein [Polyangiaceae bacterium]